MIAINASPSTITSTGVNDDIASPSGPLGQMTGGMETAQSFAVLVDSGMDLVRAGGQAAKASPAALADETASAEDSAPDIAVDAAGTLAALQLVLPGLLEETSEPRIDQRMASNNAPAPTNALKAAINGMAALAQSDLFGSKLGSPGDEPAVDDQFSAAALATRVQLWLTGHRGSGVSELPRQRTETEPAVSALPQNRPIELQSDQSDASDGGLPQRGQDGLLAAIQPQLEGDDMSFAVGGQSPSATSSAVDVVRTANSPAVRSLAHGLGTTTEWLDSLTRDIATASSGIQPLRFRVEPQNLGKIDVEVRNDAQRMSISLTASSHSALVALQDAQPRLLADVRTAGLHNAEAQIFASLADREGSRESGRHNSSPKQWDSRDTSDSDEKAATPRRRTGRLTDKFA